MKVKLLNIVTSVVLAAGLVSTLAPDAMAQKPRNVATCQENLFAGLTYICQDSGGNDNVSAIESMFGQTVIDGFRLDDYKVDRSTDENAFFTIASTSEGKGTLTFFDDSLKDSTFAFVLKGGQGFAAYLFDGIDQLEDLNWETGRPGLSHATLYVFDTPSSRPGGRTEIPEPGMLLGLVAVGGMMVGQKAISGKN
ncbi:hypothetical protein AmaxDRAFT_4739 [Limnospira maxima CS-328]|uniref:PEP-CTERM protein-sorting domain-containing protein n=1 Tax=Limnospira maxima CS-328 TaxID=513049 RepID=B5W7I9_LIMMA|nr:hypothetical protein [Limnospira maxima]EDZ92491.1 hypothetical protein AmaxDRAFT_4739 [Limnospira maxima CS-328]MDC0838335.1 PEP-CTERM sorting domain-containing protein [Limnoraphis robusta]